jgi:hypothetical protein
MLTKSWGKLDNRIYIFLVLPIVLGILIATVGTIAPAYAANAQVTISNGASLTNGTCSATSCFDPNIININVGKLPQTAPVGNYNITNMPKVKSAVPEFPVAITPLIIALISIIALTRYSKFKLNN